MTQEWLLNSFSDAADSPYAKEIEDALKFAEVCVFQLYPKSVANSTFLEAGRATRTHRHLLHHLPLWMNFPIPIWTTPWLHLASPMPSQSLPNTSEHDIDILASGLALVRTLCHHTCYRTTSCEHCRVDVYACL